MPEVNLIKDTLTPDQPPPKPHRPGQPELTDPSAGGGGFGKFLKSLLGRPRTGPAPRETSTMGLGRQRLDQRILRETRSTKPVVIPLPEDDQSGLGVNLLADELLTKFKPRERLLALAGWALGAVGIVALAYAGLALANRSVTSQIETSRTELARVQAEITGLDQAVTHVAVTTKKIAAVRSLVERHIRWTQFFTKLEAYTLPEVFYGPTFTGNIQGVLTLTASTDTYERVAQQYLVFQEAVRRGDFIKSFQISGATRTVENAGPQVTFSVTVQVLPATFVSLSDQTTAQPEGTNTNQ